MPITITTKEALNALNSLIALDGHPSVIRDGGKETVITVPYKFKPGFRLSVAKNIAKLRELATAHATATKEIFRELAGEKSEIPRNSQDAISYQEKIEELGEMKHELDIVVCKFEDLDLDVNNIQPTVVASLVPIMVD